MLVLVLVLVFVFVFVFVCVHVCVFVFVFVFGGVFAGRCVVHVPRQYAVFINAANHAFRRRAADLKQVAFNEANNITPVGVKKQIREMIDGVYKIDEAREELMAAQEQAKYEAMSEKQVAKEIKRLEKLMFEHSKNLEFEKAAQVRDQLHLLKEQLFGAPGEDNVVSITGK